MDSCLTLGLLTINREWVNLVSMPHSDDLADLTQEFKEVFQGVGCLPDEYKIEMDPMITPTQNNKRKIPIAMKTYVKTKSKLLE